MADRRHTLLDQKPESWKHVQQLQNGKLKKSRTCLLSDCFISMSFTWDRDVRSIVTLVADHLIFGTSVIVWAIL